MALLKIIKMLKSGYFAGFFGVFRVFGVVCFFCIVAHKFSKWLHNFSKWAFFYRSSTNLASIKTYSAQIYTVKKRLRSVSA